MEEREDPSLRFQILINEMDKDLNLIIKRKHSKTPDKIR